MWQSILINSEKLVGVLSQIPMHDRTGWGSRLAWWLKTMWPQGIADIKILYIERCIVWFLIYLWILIILFRTRRFRNEWTRFVFPLYFPNMRHQHKYRFSPNYDCFNMQLCAKLQTIIKEQLDSEQLLCSRDVITTIACAEIIKLEKPEVDRIVRTQLFFFFSLTSHHNIIIFLL